ncbi:hypothetical protein AAE478_009536 [Parahypoxylon ruwenzoriense]
MSSRHYASPLLMSLYSTVIFPEPMDWEPDDPDTFMADAETDESVAVPNPFTVATPIAFPPIDSLSRAGDSLRSTIREDLSEAVALDLVATAITVSNDAMVVNNGAIFSSNESTVISHQPIAINEEMATRDSVSLLPQRMPPGTVRLRRKTITATRTTGASRELKNNIPRCLANFLVIIKSEIWPGPVHHGEGTLDMETRPESIGLGNNASPPKEIANSEPKVATRQQQKHNYEAVV